MRFNQIEHLSWATANAARPKPACNLSVSAMQRFPLEELAWDPTLVTAEDETAKGYAALTRMIAEKYRVAESQVLVTLGSSGANYLAAVALVDAGDTVLIEEPVYEPLWRVFEAIGATAVFVPRTPEGSIDPSRFRKALAPRTRLIVTSNLHNPTSRHTPAETMRELGRVAASAGAYVLCDEVYLDGLFSSPEPPLPCVRALPNGISTASLTKVYGMGGLRCGWAVGPVEAITRMRYALQHVGVRHSIAAVALTVQAMRRLPELLSRAKACHERNLPILRQWVESKPALQWAPPDGGFVGFVRLPPGIDDDALVERLAREQDTWVTPGRFFRAKGGIRIGIGVPQEELVEGLRRIELVLKLPS